MMWQITSKKKIMNIQMALMLLMLLSICTYVHAQLTGSIRSDFIGSASKACFRTQRAGTPNANLTDDVLKKYCLCAMTYEADLLNNQLAKDIENGKQKLNPGYGQMAQKYCQTNYWKY